MLSSHPHYAWQVALSTAGAFKKAYRCLAALALHQFLEEHPECAADQERDCKTLA
jgi:hypothetical protein